LAQEQMAARKAGPGSPAPKRGRSPTPRASTPRAKSPRAKSPTPAKRTAPAARASSPAVADRGASDTLAGKPLYPFLMVFGGCITSIVCLEFLFGHDTACGNLVSFTDFFFVLLSCIPGQTERSRGTLRLKPRIASGAAHAIHAGLWVTMSILVNYAYAFDVSVPIHTLFRSCNIISSVLLGYLFFKKTYSARELCCVAAVSVGLFLATVGEWEVRIGDKGLFLVGVGVLTVVLMLQAWLGHMQHRFYERYALTGAKRSELADEFLFYSHAASLLPMVLMSGHIRHHLGVLLATKPLAQLPGVPAGIVWLLLNLLTQAVCIKGVFYLSANYSPLTVNLTLSVRKFVSVMLSVVLFGNPWGTKHVVASVLIFGGVFLYFQKPKATEKTK